MFGLTLHRANSADATPLEAAQKVLDGLSQFAASAIHEVRVFASRRLMQTRVESVIQEVQARIDVDPLIAAARNAREAIEQAAQQRRDAPTEHPDQTTIHLGPHAVDRQPPHNGVRHPAPATSYVGLHPRAGQRHH